MTKKIQKKTPVKKTTKKKTQVKKKPIKRGLAGRSSHSIKKDLLQALESTMGVVTTACKIAKVDRRSYYRYLQNDKKFAEDVADIQNIALDFGESKLYKAIGQDNLTAIIFYLKTKGRERGFSENIMVSQSIKSVGHITQTEPMDLETWEALAEKSLENQNIALEQLLKSRE